jgi:hypothetical protein
MAHRVNNVFIHKTTYEWYLAKYGALALCTGVTAIYSFSKSRKSDISECRDTVAYLGAY